MLHLIGVIGVCCLFVSLLFRNRYNSRMRYLNFSTLKKRNEAYFREYVDGILSQNIELSVYPFLLDNRSEVQLIYKTAISRDSDSNKRPLLYSVRLFREYERKLDSDGLGFSYSLFSDILLVKIDDYAIMRISPPMNFALK